MSDTKTNHFDEAAANWDVKPRRIELAKAVGEAILRQVQPTRGMDVLDYGCGTGLLGLFLLPHVRSVTGADSSPGMLQVLEDKIRTGGLQRMRTERLDLGRDPVPDSRYHLMVANMVMHHVDQIETLLMAFYQMLLPGGFLAIADLDTEPGVFHGPEVAQSVYHHGFDRSVFKDCLHQIGFVDTEDMTAHVIHKPVANGKIREFPVFLIVGHRALTDRPSTRRSSMIPPEVKSLFGNRQLCWMATADASGVPNVAPMRQVWWSGERSLLIGDMFMKATAANIQSTGRMCLGAFDSDTNKSWKLTGTATYETEGPNYDMAQAELHKKTPDKNFKGVVVFTIHAVYDQAPGANAGKLVVKL